MNGLFSVFDFYLLTRGKLLIIVTRQSNIVHGSALWLLFFQCRLTGLMHVSKRERQIDTNTRKSSSRMHLVKRNTQHMCIGGSSATTEYTHSHALVSIILCIWSFDKLKMNTQKCRHTSIKTLIHKFVKRMVESARIMHVSKYRQTQNDYSPLFIFFVSYEFFGVVIT